MAKKKKSEKEVLTKCGETGTLVHGGGNIKWYSFVEMSMNISKKKFKKLPYDLAFPLWIVYC